MDGEHFHSYVHACMCVSVCMCMCVCVCVYVCMYVCMYRYVSACECLHMHACLCMYMYVCMCIGNGRPSDVVRSITPSWNGFVFFEVNPVSFHQVSTYSGTSLLWKLPLGQEKCPH